MAKRRRLEPIPLEELENNPCTTGLEHVLHWFPTPAGSGHELPMGESPTGDTPIGAPPIGALQRSPKLHRCASARDGHSHTEQAVYEILWDQGRPAESEEFRYCALSIYRLAELARLDLKNVRLVLKRLVEKLAIELARESDSRRQTARVYRVYSVEGILRRRQAAGLEWVVRSKGVRFVQSPMGEPPTGD